MPYISEKKFEKYFGKIQKSLKELESVKSLSKEKYPSIEDFGSSMKSIGEMASKLVIDKDNEKIVSRNKSLKRDIGYCKKNLENLTKSKKKSLFGLVSYSKIHTSNWGDVSIKEFLRYINAGIAVYNLKYNSLDI